MSWCYLGTSTMFTSTFIWDRAVQRLVVQILLDIWYVSWRLVLVSQVMWTKNHISEKNNLFNHSCQVKKICWSDVIMVGHARRWEPSFGRYYICSWNAGGYLEWRQCQDNLNVPCALRGWYIFTTFKTQIILHSFNRGITSHNVGLLIVPILGIPYLLTTA